MKARNFALYPDCGSIKVSCLTRAKDQLHVDNSSLLESVALFESDLGKVADRHAQLIGHVNKKQKIRYTVKPPGLIKLTPDGLVVYLLQPRSCP